MRSDPRHFLPLKPVDLELLLALDRDDLHGYGLVRAIAEHSDGLIQLDPGNLYRVIKRLLADGLIAVRGDADAAERRKYYRITPLGQQVLGQELHRLRHLVAATSRPVRRSLS